MSQPERRGAPAPAARDTLRRRHVGLLVVAAGLAAALPVIAGIVRVLADDWTPLGDNAMVAIRAFDVLSSHTPLVGQSSSGATGVLDQRAFAPGPLLFWLFALPARLLQPGSLAVTAGVLNVAAVMGVVALARCRGGLGFMFATAIVIPVMLLSLPGEAVSDVWNSSVPLLPFLLLIFVGWSVASGEERLLPLLVLLASFVTQSHLTFAAPALAVAAVGLLGLAASVLRARWAAPAAIAKAEPLERRRSIRRWGFVALLVGLVCWSAPLVEQATHRPGNFVLLARAASTGEPTLGAEAGLRAVVRTTGIRPWWLKKPRSALERIDDITRGPRARGVLSTILLLAALVAVSVAGWRRRRLDVCAAGALGVALCAAVAADAKSTPVSEVATTFYTLRWTSPAGMAIWLLLGWSLVCLLGSGLARRARPAPAWWPAAALAVAGVVGFVSAAAAAPAPQPFHQMRTVAARATATTPSSGTVRVDRSASFGAFTTAVDFQAGLAYALRRDGRSVQVPDLAEKIGAHYGSGPFDHLLRVDVDDRVPRGGRPVARVDARTRDDAPPLPMTVTLWSGPSAR